MKLLHLDDSGLRTTDLSYALPATSTKLIELSRQRFQDWTGESPRGPIYSGYRRQVKQGEGLQESIDCAAKLRGDFETMVVLGIGGSALGAKTVLSALLWRVPQAQRRKVIILDNLDPIDFEVSLADINWSKTVTTIITKSGGTIETMAQASNILARYRAQNLPLKKHIVAITDPSQGSLRKWANSESLTTLSVPSDVGGRFSVLTPVGLLPCAFAGIPVAELMSGAQALFNGDAIDPDQISRLGFRLGELERSGYFGKVLMPYATVLKDFSAWFVQLWGESLGKVSFEGGARGSLPVAAVGATDQHSLLQMLVEGPDKIVTGFIEIKQWKTDLLSEPKMLPLPQEFEKLSFATGKSFSEILNAESQATQKVLTDLGKPIYRLQIETLSPQCMGALLAFYMDVVTWASASISVNPYDQPGVETCKKILPGFLK
jgi:glucose-6-phosphate isomerase